VVLAWLERAQRHGITVAVAELRSAMAANALWRVRAASRAREEVESELGRGFGLRCPKRREEKAGARVTGADARLPCMEDASTKYRTPGVQRLEQGGRRFGQFLGRILTWAKYEV
jgi:hypothetical protein